ncbi:MAG TPA: tetratricopeptide repeat protein [Phycisphaerales bacterium]|nr:tetratricopeptide repeat protein [Phycisphaerales bacterium]
MVRHGRVAVVGVVGVLAVLAACSSNRPLPVVKDDADKAFTARRYDDAAKDYGFYLGRKPEDNEVRVRLGQSQLAAGDPQAAAETLGRALDVDPLNDKIADAYAEALFQSGDPHALTEFVNRAASERGRASDYVRVGTYMQKIGHPDEAQQAFLTAARLDQGRSFDLQILLAHFYRDLGDRERYVKRLRNAYFLQPDNPNLAAEVRAVGEVPGPTFAQAPEEFVAPTTVKRSPGREQK